MFVRKGYCRFCRIKCRHFKVKDGLGYCKKKCWIKGYKIIRNKNYEPKIVSSDPNVNIKAPEYCPKFRH